MKFGGINYIERPGKTVFRHGKRIENTELVPLLPEPRKRKPFKTHFVQVPSYWVEQLEKHNSAAMYQLANRILLQDRKRNGGSDEIILSAEVTGLTRQTRAWAVQKMVKAKMIEVSQCGNQAVRVTKLLHMHPTYRR